MPIYEYTCPKCRKIFEEWLRNDDAVSMHPCPVCGEESPRMISNTSFILKGGGWYVTEYGSHKDAAGSEPADQMPAESADKPAEAAPAAKGKEASSVRQPQAAAGSSSAQAGEKPVASTASPSAAPAATSDAAP